ncbi:MAG: S-methyl-5'-thioadenosine phosphorylase [Gemmatimonadales bacterium]
MPRRPRIGVLGGTGLYALLEDGEPVTMETPYGSPSAPITVGTLNDVAVAFLPRHGLKHEYPPHVIPYRANLWALHTLGVERVLAPCAVGSLQPRIRPGEFVLCDQFVHFTHDRAATFFEGPVTTHVSTADPYCPELRRLVRRHARRHHLATHPRGTVVVIQGPRFSTRAESRFFRAQGWHVINMTQYPEVVLARELQLCYVNVSLVTDYDVGLAGHPAVKPVSHQAVLRVFNANLARLRTLLAGLVAAIPAKRGCACGTALRDARLTV